MTLQYNDPYVQPSHSGNVVLLKNKLHYLIPLIKSLPGLPRVSKLNADSVPWPLQQSPRVKPPTPGTPLSHSQMFHIPWHFCPPTAQACFSPGSRHWLYLLSEGICSHISEGLPASQIKCQLTPARPFQPRWTWSETMLCYFILWMVPCRAWKYVSGIYYLPFSLKRQFSTGGDSLGSQLGWFPLGTSDSV